MTGASGGIGREVARRLARDGFTVVATYAGNPARAQGPPTMSHAAKARRCVVIALAMTTVATFAPGCPALLLFAPLCLTALMVAAAQILTSRHEKRQYQEMTSIGAARA